MPLVEAPRTTRFRSNRTASRFYLIGTRSMLRHFSRSVHMSPDDHAYAPDARAKTKESGVTIVPSVCPHDCTSTCALDVERLSKTRIGRVRGSQRNDYTAGVICEKVARYAERIHHPDRLMKPLRRVGPEGAKQIAPISWPDAPHIVAAQFLPTAPPHGNEPVGPPSYPRTLVVGLTPDTPTP